MAESMRNNVVVSRGLTRFRRYAWHFFFDNKQVAQMTNKVKTRAFRKRQHVNRSQEQSRVIRCCSMET